MADGDYTIYILGASHRIETPLYTLFEGVEIGDLIRSRSFSRWLFIHGAILRLSEYTVNGAVQEHHTITLDSFRTGQRFGFRMFVWDREVVNDWYTEQIARTLIHSREFVDIDNQDFGRLGR